MSVIEADTRYFLEKDGKQLFATEEQTDIIQMAVGTTSNILIDSLAGAAKTSTLEFLCKYLPVDPILSIAFNKRIAEEMGKRLPGHVKCATINSVGHNVWRTAISPRLILEKDKNYKILKDLIDDLSRKEQNIAYDMLTDMKKLINRAKINGYVPDGIYPHATRLISTSEFWSEVEGEDDELLWCRSLVDQTLKTSIEQSYRGLIDFDDQIYMPTLFGGSFPQFPTVMVDEAQDLSRLNHAFLRKLVKKRLFAVGDQRQSIYGFRGAVAGGMSQLQRNFNMIEMTLSVSFRCPKKIVENARWHAPHMKYPDWAEEGEVQVLTEWDAHSIPDGSAIVCRNNAPLFSLAFKLLRAGRGVTLIGSDVGPAVIKTMKKLGDLYMKREDLLGKIDDWEREQIKKKGDKGAGLISEKAECLRVFASFGNTLGESVAYAEHIFANTGTIQLLSGHKSKGLEWDTVYHLDPHRIPSPYCKTEEDRDQERNVRYVIETRAKRVLILVTMEGFHAD